MSDRTSQTIEQRIAQLEFEQSEYARKASVKRHAEDFYRALVKISTATGEDARAIAKEALSKII